MTEHTNLRVMKGSRRRLRAGDVFVMQLPDGDYLFGRVVLVEPPKQCAPTPVANLIYVYAHRSANTEVPWAKLSPDRLLIPPAWINRLPWSRGYFLTVANQPIEPGDLLEQHCFKDYFPAPRYVDESGRDIPDRVEPCGTWALKSYRVIDDLVSEALGIPLAPDD